MKINPRTMLPTTCLNLGVILVSACLSSDPPDDERESLVQVSDKELGKSDYEAARQGLNDALKVARLAAIDVDALNARLFVGSELELALPDDDEAVLVVDAVHELLPGVTTFEGHLADDETADFTFSIEGGKLVGSIRRSHNAWLVDPHAGSGLYMMRMIDRTMLPKDEPHMEYQEEEAIPKEPDDPGYPSLPTSMIVGSGKVRVLFLYANNVPNANVQAANIVTAFNSSLATSLVAPNNYIELAGVQQVASSFNGLSRQTIRNAMSSRSAPFTTIDADMTNTYADIAFLLVQEDATAVDYPVYGRIGGIAYISNPANPFALSTDDYALGDLTALHEIGHILGGRHENDGAGGIAHGFVSPDDTWMTIMGGYIACPFTGLPATCVRLARWSNPDQLCMGIPCGTPGYADMESHLESSMPTVSGWRAEPPAPPAAPNPLVKQSGNCFGDFWMSWAAQPSATQYQLYRSTSNTFSSPVLLYSGADTDSIEIDVFGTWYLRARACNAGGCSGWTNQVSATRSNQCL